MHAGDDRAVTAFECADHIAAVHDVALGQRGGHRFEGRQHRSRMREREHRSIDHHTGEVHDTVGGGVDLGGCGLYVDAAVSGSVRSGRGEVGAGNHAGRLDRPLPPLGRGSGWRGGEEQGEKKVHRSRLRACGCEKAGDLLSVHNCSLCRNAMILAALRMSG